MKVDQNGKKRPPKSQTNEMVDGLAGVILLVISRAPAYCIRLMSVMFISSVDVVLMILLTILISFLVFLFIFSFCSFFLVFIGCDLVSSSSSRYSSFSFSVFCVIFWQSSVLSSGSLLCYLYYYYYYYYVLVTLILSGGAVAMFHRVQSLHLRLTWLVVLCCYL